MVLEPKIMGSNNNDFRRCIEAHLGSVYGLLGRDLTAKGGSIERSDNQADRLDVAVRGSFIEPSGRA